MRTLFVAFFLTTIFLTSCQAQTSLDSNRIRNSSKPITIHLHDERPSTHKPLIILQGKKVVDVNKIDPNSIKSVDVINPNDPRRKPYGRKGRYGVIVLELKSDSLFQR